MPRARLLVAVAGGDGTLDPVRPGTTTPWVSQPGSYRARCLTAGGATSLQVAPVGGAPALEPSPSPAWGLHRLDGTLPPGNLADLVGRQARAYASRSRSTTS